MEQRVHGMLGNKEILAGDTAREATSDEVADLVKKPEVERDGVDLMLRYTIVKAHAGLWKIPEAIRDQQQQKSKRSSDGRALGPWG